MVPLSAIRGSYGAVEVQRVPATPAQREGGLPGADLLASATTNDLDYEVSDTYCPYDTEKGCKNHDGYHSRGQVFEGKFHH